MLFALHFKRYKISLPILFAGMLIFFETSITWKMQEYNNCSIHEINVKFFVLNFPENPPGFPLPRQHI
jgi:hypothetical protein